MMNIWFVELGEPLPFQHEQRLLRYGELTRVLAHRGHHVTWWACDFSHQTKSFVGKPNSRLNIDGIEFVLVHGGGYRRNVSLARMLHLKVHAWNLRRLMANEPAPDIIVAAMPTTEACLVALKYAGQHRIPVVVDIRDEWPQDYLRWLSPVLRPAGRLLLAPAFAALRKVCRDAYALAAVSERQLSYGLVAAQRHRTARDRVFHTGARRTRHDPEIVAKEIEAWRKSGLTEDRFICSFSGTMSPSRPLGPVIDAVKRLSSRIPITLAIAGHGDREAEYRARAAGHPAIRFEGWINSVQMAALFEVSDVLLAPYHADYGFSMPTKIFDYLAAGKAIVSSCSGEAEQLLKEKNCGLQYRYDDSAGLETVLFKLYEDPQARRALGQTARACFEQEFALDLILERYADHLETLAAEVRQGTGAPRTVS